ncbi:MAG: hypothetical protein CME06_11850 [Gemmatimonadetes bacterium]|nr:hypothetical protein [Gemmatimonadota bacterium]
MERRQPIAVVLTILYALLVTGCGGFGSDVDGSGRLDVLHNSARLGEGDWYPRWTFIAGPAGIEAGGEVTLEIPRRITRSELLDEALDASATVSTTAANARIEADTEIDGELWRVRLGVRDGPLYEGDELMLNFHAPLPPENAGRYSIGCTVDGDGDGIAAPLASTPPILILPTLSVRVPAYAARHKPFDLSVYIDTGPMGEPFEGTLYFECSDSLAQLPDPKRVEAGGEGSFDLPASVSLRTIGYQTISARVEEDEFVFGEATVACVPIPFEYQLYFGETHEHTSYSDGRGDPRDFWRIARDIEGLDFAMLTDHDYLVNDQTWNELNSLVGKWNEPGRFVTFPAYEYSNKLGDKNVYFISEADAPMLRRMEEGTDHPEGLWRALGNRRALTIPHHAPSAFRPTDWGFHDERFQKIVEIYSLHGRTEYYWCPNPITPRTPLDQKYTTPYSTINVRDASAHDALARGHRLGFIGGGDSHSGKPAQLGLAAVWATKLTRAGVFSALEDRRCYATTNARIVLDFRVDGHIMGQEFVSDTAPTAITTVLGMSPIETIEIVRNNKVVAIHEGTETFETFSWTDAEPMGQTTYYYARVTQEDGEMAWSSPVWIDRPTADLEVTREGISISQEGADLILAGVVRNRGKMTSSPTALEIDAEVGGRPRRVGRVSIPAIRAGAEARFTTQWKDAPAGLCELHFEVDVGGRVREGDEGDNEASVEFVVGRRELFSLEGPIEPVPARREIWRELRFESGDEDVRIEVVAEVKFVGARGKNPRLLDDDLQLDLDGVRFGWEGDRAFDGSHHRNEGPRRVVLNRSLSSGMHTLRLWADETPTLRSVRIWGSGRAPRATNVADRHPAARAIESDDPRWLNFGYEDGASIFRERIDSRHVRLVMIWSKDWEATSPFTERYRWYMGELRFRNVSYAVRPWRFTESSDHIWDDEEGRVSFVSRARQPIGMEVICRLLGSGTPEVVIDLWNGGERFADRTFVGGESVPAIPFSLPLVEGGDLSPAEEWAEPRGAVSMVVDPFGRADPAPVLDDLLAERATPEHQLELVRRALEREPDNPRLHYNLGLVQKAQRRWTEAAASLERARELGLDGEGVLVNLGDVQAKRGRDPEALQLYRAAIEADEFSVRAWIGLGKLQRKLGERTAAIESFERVTAIQNFNIPGHYFLGELWVEAGDRSAAERHLWKAVELSPADSGMRKRALDLLGEIGVPLEGT